MKKILFLAAACCLVAMTATFTSCGQNNNPETPEQEENNFDKMVGTWTMKSYSFVVFNIDKNQETQNDTRDKGTLVVTKKTNGDGTAEFFYTENFLQENGEEYSGKLDFHDDLIILRDEFGFMRTNIFVYDFKVPVLTEHEMKWSYDETHTVTVNGVSRQERVTENIVFEK